MTTINPPRQRRGLGVMVICSFQSCVYQFKSPRRNKLPKVIITAQVNDATKWEAAFRTHAELFKTYSIKTPIHFTTNGSEVTICMEPEDLDAFHRAMDSKAT